MEEAGLPQPSSDSATAQAELPEARASSGAPAEGELPEARA
jgi:hypothetical protein